MFQNRSINEISVELNEIPIWVFFLCFLVSLFALLIDFILLKADTNNLKKVYNSK